MKATTILYAAIAVLLVWGLAEGVQAFRGRVEQYEARATQAEAFARQTRSYADSLSFLADSLTAANRGLADLTARRDTVVRIRYRDVLVREELEPAPDTCAPFLAVRDSLILESYAVIDSTRAIYDREVIVSGKLRASRDTLRVAVDSLVNVLHDRVGPRPWWLPTLGVGPVVGWCLDGPCAGVGVSLAWRVR